MGEDDLGMNIYINAVTDNKNTKKVTKDLVDTVRQTTGDKDGHIKVPVDIEVPIDKKNTKLTKAQTKVVQQLHDTLGKGLSDIKNKEVENLVNSFENLGSAVDKAGKSRNGKIYKEIRDQIDAIKKLYEANKTLEKQAKGYSAKVTTNNNSRKKTDNKKSKTIPGTNITEETIDGDIANHNARIEKHIKNYKKYLKQHQQNRKDAMDSFTKDIEKSLGFGESSSGFDKGRTNDYELNASELSSHGSGQARDAAKNQREAEDNPEPVTTYKPGKRGYKKKLKEVQQSSKKDKTTFTDKEINAGLQKNVLSELRKVVTQMGKGNATEATLQRYNELVDASFQLGEKGDVAIWSTMRDTLDSALSKIFKKGGNIGGTKDGKSSDKSHLKIIQRALEDTLDRITGELADSHKALEAELQRERKVIDSHKIKPVGESSKSKSGGNRRQSKATIETGSKLDKVLHDMDHKIGEQTRLAGKNLRIDMIENSAERVADSKDGEANRALLSEMKSDATTGMNTETNANTSITTQQNLEKIAASSQSTLDTISNNLNTQEKNTPKNTSKNEKDANILETRDPNAPESKEEKAINLSNSIAKYAKRDIHDAFIDDNLSDLSRIILALKGIFGEVRSINTKIIGTVGTIPKRRYTRKKEDEQPIEQVSLDVSGTSDVSKSSEKEELYPPKFIYAQATPNEYLWDKLVRIQNPNPQKLLSETSELTKALAEFSESMKPQLALPEGYKALPSGEELNKALLPMGQEGEKSLDVIRSIEMIPTLIRSNITPFLDRIGEKPVWDAWGLPEDKTEGIFGWEDITNNHELHKKMAQAKYGPIDSEEGLEKHALETSARLIGEEVGEKAFEKLSKLGDRLVDEIDNMYNMPNESAVLSDILNQYTRNGSNEKTQDKIKHAFTQIFAPTELDRVKSMSQSQIEKLRAQRSKYGLSDPTYRATDGSDRIRAERNKIIYGYRRRGKDPFANIDLSKDVDLDINGITDALQNAIEKNQFSAQTGVYGLGDIFKLSLGGIGMPSLEKSRALADGLNEMMSQARNSAYDIVNSISAKQTDLRGMIQNGKGDSSEAKVTAAQIEDLKYALADVLADMQQVDWASEKWGDNLEEVVKHIAFLSPELQKCNTIVGNLNNGLDKNGKALKYQKRIQETLNYSFQLMTRHVGQMIKNWLMMINPITLIKKSFSDFTSYSVKWQRTMNVIKYNIRRIIKPFMEWLAQQFVNIIGLANALVKGLGKAFGQNWDLFDKSAASAEKMKEELEAASNVSAGFDELHDISSDGGPAGDLSGDIYTPQWTSLYDTIENFGKKVGDVFKGIHDLTEGWNFWDWLLLIGGALVGLMALKWLLGLFSGKNPLQSVADGFKSLERSVGWALLIWAFAEFVKVLGDFIEKVGKMEDSETARALQTLAWALLELGVAIGALMLGMKFLKLDWLSLIGGAAIVTAFALLTFALGYFIDTVKELSSAQITDILIGLAVGLGIVVVAIGLLLAVLTAVVSSGVGAGAVAALALILGVVALVILAMTAFIKALHDNGEDVKLFLEGIAIIIKTAGDNFVNAIRAIGAAISQVLMTIGLIIMGVIQTIGVAISGVINTIANGISLIIKTALDGVVSLIRTIGDIIIGIIKTIADGIKTVLEPILGFIDSIIGKIMDLAKVIAHEIGETIRTVIKTTGDVIIGIIHELLNAIPNLLDSILRFCREIGPAIETSADAIMRTITKFINFMISGIEYVINTLVIGSIRSLLNGTINKIPGINIQVNNVSIPRFIPKYEQGTNYVPNDGLAYLHQGEAVVPKKYNEAMQNGNMTNEERAYMLQIMNTMRSLDSTMKQGITVNGQFVQRGSDLVAVVNRTKSQTGADLLSNVSYAR